MLKPLCVKISFSTEFARPACKVVCTQFSRLHEFLHAKTIDLDLESEYSSRMDRNIRTSEFVRLYCFDCGTPWVSDEEIICPKCGGTDKSHLRAKPLLKTKDDFKLYEGPWSDIPWPKQGTVAMYGGPGTGKSSLSSLLRPKWWLTKEQEPKPASYMFRRVTPDHMPEIISVDNAEEVINILMEISGGPLVVDSLTAFGLKESLEVAHAIVNWSRRNTTRALAILQANQGGGAAGYLEIPHLFDAVIQVAHDPWGVRVFKVEKSRWSSLKQQYFTFDGQGQISTPEFVAAYSVEGNTGSYYLHPYPIRGAKWSGLLRFLDEHNGLKPGVCGCSQIAPYMPSGFVEPMDILQRKDFAERSGLKWIGPETIGEYITLEEEEET